MADRELGRAGLRARAAACATVPAHEASIGHVTPSATHLMDAIPTPTRA